jgi:hypothetical protein
MKKTGLLAGVFLGGAALFAETVVTIYVGAPSDGEGAYDTVASGLSDAADRLVEYAQDGGDYMIVLAPVL